MMVQGHDNTIAKQTTEKSQRKNRFLHCSVKKLM